MRASWQKRASKSIVVHRGPSYDRYWHSVKEEIEGVYFPIVVRDAGYSIWKKNAGYQRDTYSYLGVELVTAGNIIFTQNGISHTVNPGQAFIKHPGNAHAYRTGPTGYAHKRFITLSGSILETIIANLNLSRIMLVTFKSPTAFEQLYRAAIHLICSRHRGNNADLSTLAYAVLMELTKHAAHRDIDPALIPVVDYMRQFINTSVTIHELCEHANMSRAQLFRLFAQQYNMSPMQYFELQKMKLGEEMLRSGTYTVKAITYMLGYKNPFLFSKKFKKYAGISPRQFKKSARAASDADTSGNGRTQASNPPPPA
jgi:AraC-like DNA-binding protein